MMISGTYPIWLVMSSVAFGVLQWSPMAVCHNHEHTKHNNPTGTANQNFTINDPEFENLINITVQTRNSNLPIPIPEGILVMLTDSQRTFRVNFTLRCPSPEARFYLSAVFKQISHQRVARLNSDVSVPILCDEAVEMFRSRSSSGPPEVHGKGKNAVSPDIYETFSNTSDHTAELVVSGHLNLSLLSNFLGKGVLLFFLAPLPLSDTSETMTLGVRSETSSLHNQISAAFGSAERASTHQKFTPKSAASTSSIEKDAESESLPPPPQNTPNSRGILVKKVPVLVLRPRRLVDKIFRACIYILVITATTAMGCKTDLSELKEILKKPTAPAIGFVSQYLFMPLIAYGIARGLDLENKMVALGIFACGICPGGGASNMFSYLLGGDLTLSVTMTTLSTIAAFGMIPLWLFTLGQTLEVQGQKIQIPFTKILEALAIILLPLFFGLLLQYKLSKVAKVIVKLMKPVFVVAVAFMLSVGIYANIYVFQLFDTMTVLAGCMLPYIGYFMGGILALLCRQPWTKVKTIALETGIQNMAVAALMLIFSFPVPDGELALVGPAASGVMTPIPPLLLALAYFIYNKVKGKPSPRQQEKEMHALCTDEKSDIVERDVMPNGASKDMTNKDKEENVTENEHPLV